MNIKAIISALAPIVELIDILEHGPQGRTLYSNNPQAKLDDDGKDWTAIWKAEKDSHPLVSYCDGEKKAAITIGMLRGIRFIHGQLELQLKGKDVLEAYVRHKINPLITVIDMLESKDSSLGEAWRSTPDDFSHWGTGISSRVPGRNRVNLRTGDLRRLRALLAT